MQNATPRRCVAVSRDFIRNKSISDDVRLIVILENIYYKDTRGDYPTQQMLAAFVGCDYHVIGQKQRLRDYIAYSPKHNNDKNLTASNSRADSISIYTDFLMYGGLSVDEKLLFVNLLIYEVEDKDDPPMWDIADSLGVSRKHVNTLVRRLKAKGFIDVIRPSLANGGARTNVYKTDTSPPELVCAKNTLFGNLDIAGLKAQYPNDVKRIVYILYGVAQYSLGDTVPDNIAELLNNLAESDIEYLISYLAKIKRITDTNIQTAIASLYEAHVEESTF